MKAALPSRALRQLALAVFLLPALSSSLQAFEFLSEFVSAQGNLIRNSLASVQPTDQIVAPRWSTQSPLNFRLCVGGNAIGAADILYHENRDNELLADAQAALEVWKTALAGTDLELGEVSLSTELITNCGPNEGSAYGGDQGPSKGHFDIFFNNVFDSPDINPPPIDPGIVAFAILTLELNSGQLRIKDGDIVFNTFSSLSGPNRPRFVTQAWINANNPSLNANNRFSFQGVLTHEFGHVLGLAHSLVVDKDIEGKQTQASMFPAVSNLGQTIQLEELHLDDIVAAKTLYQNETTFSGSQFGGSISGVVRRPNNQKQRGAQVVAYSTERNQTLAARMSSLENQTAGSPDGFFRIDGLPLNEEFIVFIEPSLRQSIHPNFNFAFVNTPLIQALSSQSLGLSSFFLEAFPDAPVADVRNTGSLSSSPGSSEALRFTLTSSQPQRQNIDFFISSQCAVPNDACDLSLQITTPNNSQNEVLVISNSQPLQISVTAAANMSALQNPSLEVRALPEGESLQQDWSGQVANFNSLQSSEALFTIGNPSGVSNGKFTLNVSLKANSATLASASKSIELNNWTDSTPSLVFGENLTGVENSSSNSGGCQAQASGSSQPWLLLLAFILALFGRGFFALRTCGAKT